MRKTIKINCNDVNEILRLFILSDDLHRSEETILPFGSRIPMQITKTNKAKVPQNEAIATATGIADVSKDCKLTISVAADSGAKLNLIGKKNELTEEESLKVDNFLSKLQENGYNFEREWNAC